MITYERLREVIDYNPETGIPTWKQISKNSKMKIGDIAGCINKVSGYREIKIDGKSYKMGRLAWLYMTGELPPIQVDHENRIRHDDRFNNLRLATWSQQQRNKNTKGVSFSRDHNKWRARIITDEKRLHLGYHNTFDEARSAYLKAKEIHHPFYIVK